jgi:predicted HicB family RNase H-like nuclease
MMIETSLYARAKEAAKKEGLSLAGFIRQLITRRLDEIGK